MNRVCITVDMEQDCPPYLESWHGVEQGTPKFLALLADTKTPATFFTTGELARRYPGRVQEIIGSGHELGGHGDQHRRFDHMDLEEARAEIAESTRTLRAFHPVTSFRAPNLRFPLPF